MKQIFSLILLFLLICSPCYAGVDFNGDADYINCGTDSSLAITGDITIATWLQLGHFGHRVIIRKLNNFHLEKSTIEGWVTVKIDGSTVIGAGKWAYDQEGIISLIVTRDVTNDTAEAWVDGVSQGEVSYTGTPSGGANECDIGAFLERGTYYYFYNDLVEEIAVWNTKLSDDEVALLYSSKLKRMPLQIQPANLKLYLPLDDHTAGTALNTTVFKDLSGNGNDGTGTDADADSSTTAEVLNYPPAIGQFN